MGIGASHNIGLLTDPFNAVIPLGERGGRRAYGSEKREGPLCPSFKHPPSPQIDEVCASCLALGATFVIAKQHCSLRICSAHSRLSHLRENLVPTVCAHICCLYSCQCAKIHPANGYFLYSTKPLAGASTRASHTCSPYGHSHPTGQQPPDLFIFSGACRRHLGHRAVNTGKRCSRVYIPPVLTAVTP